VIDLTPKQTLLSPLSATSKVKAKRSATRASYAAHTPNGKKMILILERWGKEQSTWKSITKFAKSMARLYFEDESKYETIRQRIGKRKLSMRGLDDKRSAKGLLKPTTRQALSEILALKDEKSEGAAWSDLKTLCRDVKPSLTPKQVENAALSVLLDGRKTDGPLKEQNMRAQKHTSKRCEVRVSPCCVVFYFFIRPIAFITSSCIAEIETNNNNACVWQ